MNKLAEEKKKNKKQEDSGRSHVMWADVFQPSDDNTRGDKNKGLNGQFSVEYDVDRDTTGGEVVVSGTPGQGRAAGQCVVAPVLTHR